MTFPQKISTAGHLFRIPAEARVTVSTDVVALKEQGADYVLLNVESATIRYRVTGSDPTSTTGIKAPLGSIIELENSDEVDKFRAIRDSGSGTDATLEVHPARRHPDDVS